MKRLKRNESGKPQEGKARRRKRLAAAAAGALALAAGAAALFFYSYHSRVYKRCVFEAGVDVTAEDFLKKPGRKIAFAKDSGEVDIHVPGDYPVKLKSGIFTYDCTATIQDTIPPEAEAADVYYEEGQTVSPEEFAASVKDETEVAFAFETAPDYSVAGKQNVSVSITDLGGNRTVIGAALITRATVKELTMEAGADFPAIGEFLLPGGADAADASFATDPSSVPTGEVGDYEIEIACNGSSYKTLLRVRDTTPPVVKTRNVSTYKDKKIGCEAFIASAKDATGLTYRFAAEPDVSILGDQPVSIIVTDAGGNTVTEEAVLTVFEDTQPPVIVGAADFTAYLGSRINYKDGVSVYDDHAEKPKLTVDTSYVDTGQPGTYPVIYTATDDVGNSSSVTVYITLIQRVIDEAEVNRLADEVLAQIVSPEMAPYDKLTAIYNWVRGHLAYADHSEKGSWVNAAYEGLENRRGDCYVYASTAKALLTRAGIENLDIEKIPDRTRHYWNLVNIGEGWYHFDTTPRKGVKLWMCYITDAELMALSQQYEFGHNYDRSVYTDIQ